MRMKIKGYHFQRTPLIAYLVLGGNRIEFDASPEEIHDWARRIFMAAEFNKDLDIEDED